MERWAMPLKWGTNPHDHDLYTMLADTAAQQRDLDAIRHYAPLAEELAVRDDHKLYRAMAHRVMAVAHRLAGEYDDAETRLNHALELFQPLGTRWQIGRTLFEWGELDNARRNSASTRDYFSRALVEFDALGAVVNSANTRARIQDLST
jgi:tetratricopeptide (TPR) repeat protein